MRQAVESLGAATSDETRSVAVDTIVIVNPVASPTWSHPSRSGTKIERAEKLNARIFRLSDFVHLLRQKQVLIPHALHHAAQDEFPI